MKKSISMLVGVLLLTLSVLAIVRLQQSLDLINQNELDSSEMNEVSDKIRFARNIAIFQWIVPFAAVLLYWLFVGRQSHMPSYTSAGRRIASHLVENKQNGN